MAGRREWVPCFNWGAFATVAAGSFNTALTWWGEDELYSPAGAQDSCTFLRLKGHIVVEESSSEGTIGWRVRIGTDSLDAGGAPTTAGEIDDSEVAEEHFLDERFWFYDTTAQPSSWSHPYYTTFDTASKRKLASPQALVVTFGNGSGVDIRVQPYLRGLFLFP